MLQTILENVSRYIPQVSGYLSFFVLTSWLSIQGYKFYMDTKEVCRDHEDVSKKLTLLLEKFNSLIVVMGESNALKNPDMFSINSPLNLTSKGGDLVQNIGWVNVMHNAQSKAEIFQLLDKLSLHTKADVEKYSIVIINELYANRTQNPFTVVKEYLYNNASIDRQDALFACALYLRDAYLSEHTSIE